MFITVKIKIILLFLFLGGGIFYGLKIWQGTALGCPEPIIQEIKHHDGILPYSGYSGSDISSYPGPPPDAFGSGSFGGVYSMTPGGGSPSYSGPSYLPPTNPGNAYLPPGGDSFSSPTDATDPTSPPSGNIQYTNRRRYSSTGRQISDESVSIFGDLVFRFLGVSSDQCRRRFVCELEYRNPFMQYAVRYFG